MVKSRLLVAVGIVAVVGVLTAQAPAPPAFEVASVKPSGPLVPLAAGMTGFLHGGRYVVRYTNVLNLIAIAYRPAGPGSLGFDHIDVTHEPSWVTALQDQLGLKLERHVEAQEMLVIDHVEPPTPD